MRYLGTGTTTPSPRLPRRRLAWSAMGLGLAGGVFALDQLSKWFVLTAWMVPPRPLPVTSFLNIVLAWNRGVSFGLLSNDHPYGAWILITIALGLALLLMRWIWQAETRLMAAALGLVLGGAVGNLMDRLRFGAVTDFLDFHAFGYHWYTFNIADAGIVIGVALILFESWKEAGKEQKP